MNTNKKNIRKYSVVKLNHTTLRLISLRSTSATCPDEKFTYKIFCFIFKSISLHSAKHWAFPRCIRIFIEYKDYIT